MRAPEGDAADMGAAGLRIDHGERGGPGAVEDRAGQGAGVVVGVA
jgi:hypothetical protein